MIDDSFSKNYRDNVSQTNGYSGVRMVAKIDKDIFMMTFSSDANYHVDFEDMDNFLDKKTGTLKYGITNRDSLILLMGEEAVEDFTDSSFYNERPDRYLEIPGMSHGEHHSVMQNFLNSDWTDDQARIDHASNVYYPRKSIGYWLKNVGDQRAVDAYFAFREVDNLRLAEEFLRENGVADFEWV